MQLQSYKAVANFDLEPGTIVWIARGEKVFEHEQFSPIIGDAIHNLRDALDLAVSVLMRNAGLPDANVYFPTGKTFDAFQKAVSGGPKKPKFPPKLVAVLQSRIQPYFGGHGHYIRTLHDLAIADKHRLIVPTVFGVNIVHMRVDGMGEIPIRFFGQPVPIKDGCKLARIVASEWPQIEVNQEADITFAIEFDKGTGQMFRWSVNEGLIRLMNVTKEAIEALETCLP